MKVNIWVENSNLLGSEHQLQPNSGLISICPSNKRKTELSNGWFGHQRLWLKIEVKMPVCDLDSSFLLSL